MDDSEYFGKDCEYFVGQWENIGSPMGSEYYNKGIPELTFCAHPNNINDCEGNCNKHECPLNKKEV